ncbi:MAG TPA: hypothetical protein VFM16_06865 [Holophagaceae bacterium]|nr:hypothetical protein [Holophagaceae bacterium]
MVSLAHLWLPILLSAVFVFVASSLIHMVLKWHNSDYHGLGNEDEVRAAVRKADAAPGMYVIPYCKEMKDMGSEDMQRKFKEGPVGFLILRQPGPMAMGKNLVQWFLFCAVTSFFCAYLAGHVLPAGTPYLTVFRVIGTAAFMAYSFGSLSMAIWWGQPWGAALKDILDGLIYGLVTAGTFGWLWPHA